jgi:feruloyl esterase
MSSIPACRGIGHSFATAARRSPDISAFQAKGSKLIVYQGWADPVVNPLDTINYYNAAMTKQGLQASMDGFFRLFMVPGMGH